MPAPRALLEPQPEPSCAARAINAVAERSDDLAMAGVGYAVAGIVDLEVAEEAGDVARELVAEGVADVAVGSMEIGAGETLLDVGEVMAQKAQ